MDRPWLSFWTRDWLDSKELRRCSAESRALLVDLMCLAHEGKPYGFLTDDIGPLTDDYIASRCFMKTTMFRRLLTELKLHKRVSVTKDGILCIERMVSDEKIRMARAAGGSKGGNPKLKSKVNHKVEPTVEQKHAQEGLPPSDYDSDCDSSIDVDKVVVSAASDFDLLAKLGWTMKASVKSIKDLTDEQATAIIALKNSDFEASDDPDSARGIWLRLCWFDESWEAYWRKDDKKSARIAYFACVRTGDEYERILEAIIRQAPEMNTRPRPKRPQFATWLHHERWNDEVSDQPSLLENSYAN